MPLGHAAGCYDSSCQYAYEYCALKRWQTTALCACSSAPCSAR